MRESLKNILEIQELDMKMIRLMRVKKDRQKELSHIHAVKEDCARQVALKELEVLELKKHIRIAESQVAEVVARIERLEGKQNTLKKVEEFSALSQEITSAEREKTNLEQQVSDLIDRLSQEEDLLKASKETLKLTEENSDSLEKEIKESVKQINEEGIVLEQERKELVKKAPEDLFKIYERLLRNKKDRVVVPIENRTCSGCHIVLTAQHENLVRRGERSVFCEHCSRMHYWQDSEAVEGSVVATKKRRRKAS
jgi:predicted  nucleic acid-binding Zn-ribbon protein